MIKRLCLALLILLSTLLLPSSAGGVHANTPSPPSSSPATAQSPGRALPGDEGDPARSVTEAATLTRGTARDGHTVGGAAFFSSSGVSSTSATAKTTSRPAPPTTSVPVPPAVTASPTMVAPTPVPPVPTLQPSIEAKLHVGDLDGSTARSGKGWKATVTAKVLDPLGRPMSGVVVSGTYIVGGVAGRSVSCTTTTGGVCSLTSAPLNATTPATTFVVGGVAKSGFAYDPAGNRDPDGDSTGTAIVVTKPGG